MNTNASYDLEHELFNHLIDGLKDYAIFLITPEGLLGTWNPGVKRILGYDESEFINKPFSMIFTDSDVKLGIHSSELEIAKQKGRTEDERWHKKKDGSTFWASGLVTVIRDSKGALKGYSKIMRNQTEKKKMEEELIEHANALVIANRELVNFAGIVSHDLKAPLQTIYGFANILKEKAQENINDEVAQESVTYIASGAEKMMHLVSELLEQAADPKIQKDRILVNTDQLVHSVLEQLSSSIERRGAKIFCESLPNVWADDVQLARVFQNLIDNACKYSKKDEAPIITIKGEENDNNTVFSVSDNGIGISKDESLKIFSLFQRSDGFQEEHGYGIGLGVSRKIIESFGGKIWVKSELGKGSTFYFTIPHFDQNDMHLLDSKVSLRA
jgi:PAS domain S-box-containing protein